MEDVEQRIVDGFLFATEADANVAIKEKTNIEYLEDHMDYDKPEEVLKVYERMLEKRLFQTPVGFGYLHSIRKYLQNNGVSPDDIRLIPVYSSYAHYANGEEEQVEEPFEIIETTVQKDVKKKETSVLRFSVTLNILLVITVIAMFVISLKSDIPNIINYEKAIINKYAAWQQELSEKELKLWEQEKNSGQ